MESSFRLNSTGRATLGAVCEAFLPSLEPHAGDEPGLFQPGAHSQNILPHVEEILGTQPRSLQRELTILLRLLEQPWFVGWLCGRYLRFSSLPQLDRERVLLSLAGSRLPILRKSFQGLKRLCCFLFYAGESARGSVWQGIGYETHKPVTSQTERLSVVADLASDAEFDACIIGSGAGGSAVAAQLAAAGLRVLVLEAAPASQAADFEPLELEGLRSLYWRRGLLATHDLSTMILAGSALGGGTAVNWQTSLRTPDDVRAEWATNSGCRFLAEPDFSAALDVVCARLSVSTAESHINANNDILRRGCDALGYHWSLLPRNAQGCVPDQCGYCMFGCPTGGKQSAAVTFLRDAMATGHTTLAADCVVERIEHSNGRVTGVQARMRGRRVRVRASTVVVAAGGIESPAILLRSGITLPALGRHLHLHPTTCVAGFLPQPVRAWQGPPQSVVCDDFADLADGYGFRLETAPAHPGLFALAMPWRGGRHHRELMQNFSHAAAVIVLARDHSGGRVTIDRQGNTRVQYTVGPREHGYLARGAATAARVLAAAGAERITTTHTLPIEWHLGDDLDAYCHEITSAPLDRNWSPVLTAHQLGSCRMGSSQDSAVCNQDGAVFGMRGLYIGDASALPGSCGVNPMVTVAAFGWWVGARIVSAVGR